LYFSNQVNTILKKPLILSGLLFFLIIASSVLFLSHEELFKADVLNNILEKNEISIITRNNAHCYYIYRDQKMGFEYDLAKEFADYLGVKLKIIIIEKWEDMIPRLMSGQGQVIAASLTITPKRKKIIMFSKEYMTTQQQIIVNRENHTIHKLEDLSGKTIYVRKGTSYEEQLKELQKKGMSIKIKAMDNIPTAELIQKVAKGEIDITIADSNVAMLNRRYFPKAVARGYISNRDHIGWAVSPGAKELLEKINEFFNKIQEDGTFNQIYKKYYSDIDLFDYVDLRAYHRRLHSRLPKYIPLIRAIAEQHGFDWRIIAAQIYQESHFHNWAKSPSGAYGLMQLTSKTAQSYGVEDLYDPKQNISAGVRHLKELYDLFTDAEGADRLFIAFGAYNTGQGHIRDAQRLAKKMNLDPNKWSSLSKTLPLLRKWEYFKDAKYGYCRGTEPVQYVRQIMIYYDILRHQGLEYHQGLSEPPPQI
jgi:membrane-bound lytic murein transglycosylase F